MTQNAEIIIYDGDARVEVHLRGETVWLTQAQMAELFAVQKAAISKHLKNIFGSGELDMVATVSKVETVQTEGRRSVKRLVEYFNLDAVISVGYRVNSTRATRFRQWATAVLRQHLTQGYTLNRQRFEHNAAELEAALALVKKAAAGEITTDQGRGLVDVIARYTQTRVHHVPGSPCLRGVAARLPHDQSVVQNHPTSAPKNHLRNHRPYLFLSEA